MKGSLCLMCLFTVAALVALPLACAEIDSQKESVVIEEEVLFGDPTAAAGVTMDLATHWNGHLLWDTEYTVGSGKEAESRFTFSSSQVRWIGEGSGSVRIDSITSYGASGLLRPLNDYMASSANMDDANVSESVADMIAQAVANGDLGLDSLSPEDVPLNRVIAAAAGRTEPGESSTAIVKLSDYYQYYPIHFSVSAKMDFGSVSYSESVSDFFTRFFHVTVPEGHLLKVEVTRNEAGVYTEYRSSDYAGAVLFENRYDFGTQGCYFAFCCGEWESEERVDCGENSGIFYMPYVKGQSNWTIAPEQIRKLCELPEKVMLGQMMLDETEEKLYLAVKEEEEYALLVYELDEEKTSASLTQWIPIPLKEKGEVLYFAQMTREEGGILIKWLDGGFAFIAEENGICFLWCVGRFQEEDTENSAYSKRFPWEHACAFDGERLVLAAYEELDSANVLLGVYGPEGERYFGRYGHVGEWNSAFSELYFRDIAPQGFANGAYRVKGKLMQPIQLYFKQ